jgi:hypothetical protein
MKKVIIFTIFTLFLINYCNKKQQDQPVVVKETTQNTVITSPDTIKAEAAPPDTIEQSPAEPAPAQPEVKKTEEELTTADLWDKYRKFREDSKTAFNNSEFQQAIANLKMSAKYAKQLGRNDLVAWQYNNIGYYSILEFKGLTNYDYRMHQLRTIKDDDERKKYSQKTKELFRKHIKILNDAQVYLEQAYEIDQNYKVSNRTEKIFSNLKFIDWIKNFVKK